MALDFQKINEAAENYRADMAAFLRAMISHPSESCEEKEVVACIKAEMEKLNFDKVEVDGLGNVIGWMGDGEKIIAIDSHIDTVGIGNIDNWEQDPYKGYETDEIIYGRGGSDQEGGMASAVYGAKIMKDLDLIPEGYKIMIVGSVQEEDCDGMCWQYIYNKDKIVPEFVISTEPTDGGIYRGHRGRMEIRVDVKGVSCHGSAPERGDNAIYKMADIIADVRALNNNAWDGRWYKRAFTDDGDALGSLQNEECKIDSISQSWATISGAGNNDKKYIAMESLENHLVDKEIGIIKLLDPPFEKSKLEPGYIKAYLPGTRENGGQYTHAATWTIIAQTMLNLNDKAYENFRMINPIEHARTKDESSKYKVEPYVIAADVYGQGNLAGRGGWTWYTGSSSWMYIAGIKYILGLNIENGYLKIEPHIPQNWDNYEIKYKYKNSVLNIKITRGGLDKNSKKMVENNTSISDTTIVKQMICNGEEIQEKQIKIGENGVYNIEVII